MIKEEAEPKKFSKQKMFYILLYSGESNYRNGRVANKLGPYGDRITAISQARAQVQPGSSFTFYEIVEEK